MPTIRVLPNPFAAFDRNGIPCAVCPRDPDADAGGPGQFVGARVSDSETQVLQVLDPSDFIRSARQKTVYEYLGVPATDPELASKLLSAVPVEIPSTPYYRARVAEGSLLCADAASADVAKFKHFIPLAAALHPFLPKVDAVTSDEPSTASESQPDASVEQSDPQKTPSPKAKNSNSK